LSHVRTYVFCDVGTYFPKPVDQLHQDACLPAGKSWCHNKMITEQIYTRNNKNSLKGLMKYSALILTVFLFTLTLSAQTITWQRSYGGLGPVDSEECNAIVQTPDSGYIFVGNTRPGGGGGSYMMATRLNKFGDSLWFRYYNFEVATGIIADGNGNYILVGNYANLIKIDISGDTIWTRRRGNSSIRTYQMKRTSDGGLIIAGEIGLPTNPFLMKTDSLGRVLWERTYSQYFLGRFTDIAEYKGGFLLCGTTNSFMDMLIFQCDVTGIEVFDKTYQIQCSPINMVVLNCGDIVLGGNGKPLSSEGVSAFLIKLNSNFNIIWKRTYDPGEPQFGTCDEMIRSRSGGYLLVGSTNRDSIFVLAPVARILKTDSEGNLVFQRKYGFDSSSQGNLVGRFLVETNDNGLALGGSRDEGGYNYHVIKSDSLGFVNPVQVIILSEEVPGEFELTQNYPNPFNSTTMIRFIVPAKCKISIEVFDQMGRKISELVNSIFKPGVYQTIYSATDLPSGIYYCRMSGSTESKTVKMILVK
jgi:hypothetical protein